jgi:hypothetical protein
VLNNNREVNEEPVEIRLENCIARGEGTFLLSDENQPVDLFWKNGLLVSSQRLLEVYRRGMPVRSAGAVTLNLQYLTAFTRGGLLRVVHTDGAPLVPVEITCSDSILMGGEQAALIELHRGEDPYPVQDSIIWRGDRNFYEGFGAFLLSYDASESDPEQLGFAEWQAHWQQQEHSHENMPRNRVVAWRQLPPSELPPHEHTVQDYALDDRLPGNPARGGAADGSDVGFRARLWPAPPSPPSTVPVPAEPDDVDQAPRQRNGQDEGNSHR